MHTMQLKYYICMIIGLANFVYCWHNFVNLFELRFLTFFKFQSGTWKLSIQHLKVESCSHNKSRLECSILWELCQFLVYMTIPLNSISCERHLSTVIHWIYKKLNSLFFLTSACIILFNNAGRTPAHSFLFLLATLLPSHTPSNFFTVGSHPFTLVILTTSNSFSSDSRSSICHSTFNHKFFDLSFSFPSEAEHAFRSKFLKLLKSVLLLALTNLVQHSAISNCLW